MMTRTHKQDPLLVSRYLQQWSHLDQVVRNVSLMYKEAIPLFLFALLPGGKSSSRAVLTFDNQSDREQFCRSDSFQEIRDFIYFQYERLQIGKREELIINFELLTCDELKAEEQAFHLNDSTCSAHSESLEVVKEAIINRFPNIASPHRLQLLDNGTPDFRAYIFLDTPDDLLAIHETSIAEQIVESTISELHRYGRGARETLHVDFAWETRQIASTRECNTYYDRLLDILDRAEWRGIDDICKRMIHAFSKSLNLHNVHIFPQGNAIYDIVWFLKEDKNLRGLFQGGSGRDQLIDFLYSELDKAGRGSRADVILRMSWDTDENIQKNWGGSYQNRLRA